uniref:Uncharacterized protein n=1 Tax=Denticeps clupeoides TaxID=299321 RepID=A0AAY4CC86_9TELE
RVKSRGHISLSYNRTQYCKWPCKCPRAPLTCPLGVSLVTDGCDCCKTCARQVGESCNEKDTCDHHKGLYCDYSSDKPRYEQGVCACKYLSGTGCEYEGVVYRNGQSFQPNCKYQCLCVNGAIGCLGLSRSYMFCNTHLLQYCTVTLITINAYGKRPREDMNCPVQTTPWSPCSRTCGRGVSMRISNGNKQCQMMKESRLCSIRPCQVDISKHFRPGKKCLNIYRERQPSKFTISGCTSKKAYWPKYCGVCTDNRCCIPYKSKSVTVDFECPSGATFSWQVMWINACFCNLSCKKPGDIFAELGQHFGFSEVMN